MRGSHPTLSPYSGVQLRTERPFNRNRMNALLYSLSMVMRDIGSFHYPEPMFISRDAVEGNKHGHGAMETACIPK